MNQIKKLEQYCRKILLNFSIKDDVLCLDEKEYLIITDDRLLFDEDFNFLPAQSLLPKVEREYSEGFGRMLEYEVDSGTSIPEDGWVYEFGGRWYLQHKEVEEAELTELKNIGKAVQKLPTKAFLGVHSGYELLNGLGLYADWIKKAKFLGIEALGICEKSTLAGVIDFQNQCQANDIKSIIGMTVPIRIDNGPFYLIKCYAKGFQGWLNLLKFSTKLNVDEEVAISPEFLIENSRDLVIVYDPKTMMWKDRPNIPGAYYQLETVRFESSDKDEEFVNNYEQFLTSNLEPIAIYDAYYPEQSDWEAREALWKIGKAFDFRSKNQYMRSSDEYAKELIQMFEDDCKSWIPLFKRAHQNLDQVVQECNFVYDTTSRRLPKYKMTPEEAEQFKSNEELFLHLIKKGFKERNIQDPQRYVDRLKTEISVLKRGDVIDYFLVLHDIIGFAKREKLLTGIGRGSAGGSLVSYLLGLIQIDPLEFDLLFSRFLNEGRMGELVDCKAYEIVTDEKVIILNEGSLLRVLRKGEEWITFIQDLQESDKILKY